MRSLPAGQRKCGRLQNRFPRSSGNNLPGQQKPVLTILRIKTPAGLIGPLPVKKITRQAQEISGNRKRLPEILTGNHLLKCTGRHGSAGRTNCSKCPAGLVSVQYFGGPVGSGVYLDSSRHLLKTEMQRPCNIMFARVIATGCFAKDTTGEILPKI